MDLSNALKAARRDIEAKASTLNAQDETSLPYWLSELNTEATASQIAIDKIILPASSLASQQLPALLKSIEIELNIIAKTAGSAAKIVYEGRKLRLNNQLRAIETHVTRHHIKSSYTENHLSEYLGERESQHLGQEFLDERQHLSRNMRLMDEGG
jgi:hypothetical protein